MNRIIRVECWADFYFFGRLLENKELIRKEKNKPEVFKSIKDRSRGEFSIGIVDSDNESIDGYIKGFEVEYRLAFCAEVELYKLRDFHYYIILLSPKEFESWIVRFIENDCQRKLSEFGYDDFKAFTIDSKVIYEKLVQNEKFKNILDFVLQNLGNSDNHIRKLKLILQYLIEKKYMVDINEIRNV